MSNLLSSTNCVNLKQPFDAINEVSEEDISRSQSFNNLDGTCIETSPVNRYHKEANIPNLGESILKLIPSNTDLCMSPSSENNDKLIDKTKNSKLDQIIEDFMNSPASKRFINDSETNNQGTPFVIDVQFEKSLKNTQAKTNRVFKKDNPLISRSYSQINSFPDPKKMSQIISDQNKNKKKDAFKIEQEYEYNNETTFKREIKKTAHDETQQYNFLSSPATEFSDSNKFDDRKRFSLCENTSKTSDSYNCHWTKKQGSNSKQLFSVSKELFAKKRPSIVMPKSQSKQKLEHVNSSESCENNQVIFKKSPLPGSDKTLSKLCFDLKPANLKLVKSFK